MSKAIVYKVGQVIQSFNRQFAKIISIKDGRYGLSGFTSLANAKKADTAIDFFNDYGMEINEFKIVSGKSNDDEDSDLSPDDNTDDTGTESNSPLARYTVIGEIIPQDEDGTPHDAALEIGSIQEVPTEVGDDWVEKGLAEKVPTKSELNKLSADDVRALAGKLGLSAEGTKPVVLEGIIAHYGL